MEQCDVVLDDTMDQLSEYYSKHSSHFVVKRVDHIDFCIWILRPWDFDAVIIEQDSENGVEYLAVRFDPVLSVCPKFFDNRVKMTFEIFLNYLKAKHQATVSQMLSSILMDDFFETYQREVA